MGKPNRRSVVATVGLAAIGSLAGCSAVIDYRRSKPPTLNIWVVNDLSHEIDYEVMVESITNSGSLAADEKDVYVDALDQSSLSSDVTVGARRRDTGDGGIVALKESECTFQLDKTVNAVFARFTDGEIVYGLTKSSGEN